MSINTAYNAKGTYCLVDDDDKEIRRNGRLLRFRIKHVARQERDKLIKELDQDIKIKKLKITTIRGRLRI